MINKNYKGREQAYIKHTLLQKYLQRLFMIIGQHEKVINYVDCFAGPWQEKSEDLNDTSISISLDIMNQCKAGLAKLSKYVQFRALFIEKDKQSFTKLEDFLARKKWAQIETQVMKGDFFELRDSINSWCGTDSFAFFFIDPKGWKNVVEINTLQPLLKRRNSEFLINFMFDFILRTHTQPDFSHDMKAIFGEIPDTENMSPAEREKKIITLYLENLKKSLPHEVKKPRLAHVKVLYPTKDRTFYDLVYLTRHPLGIKVFMEESEKLDIIQKSVRAVAKQNKRIETSGQRELFDASEGNQSLYQEDELHLVKEFWQKKLTNEPKYFGLEELADIYEETGWFNSALQKAFKELENEGKVKNYDSTKKRPKHVIHFGAKNNRGERLGKIEK